MPSNLVEVLKVKSAARQTFTVAASTEVDIALPVGDTILENVYQNTFFKRLDSPLVLEAGVMFPYAYGLSTEPMYISMSWIDDASVNEFIAAAFTLPAGVCSISFFGGSSPGLFLPHPGLGSDAFAPALWLGKARLTMSIITGKVSMINSPAALSGALKVIPWVRLQHSFPLEVA